MAYYWPDFVEECKQCQSCELSTRKNVVIYRVPLSAADDRRRGTRASEDEQSTFCWTSRKIVEFAFEGTGSRKITTYATSLNVDRLKTAFRHREQVLYAVIGQASPVR